jgi:transcription initiation factor TFIIB
MDEGPEWRAFTPDEKRSKERVGGPNNYAHYDKGLSTTIRIDKDAFGRPLPAKVKRQMWRLRRWQLRSRIHSSDCRNLMQAMNELERISEILHIPSSVQEMAAVLYRKALKEGLIRGRCIAALIAAALYAACRFTKTPKTLNEIAEASLRDKDEVARSYRLVVRRLMMKMPIHDPLNYISKIAEKANIIGEDQGFAVKLLREAKRKHITVGKDPYGIAAAVLYIACKLRGKKKTQKEIAEAAGVTEVTVRNRKKDLMKKLNINSWLKNSDA